MKRRRQVYAAFLCIPLILLGCYPEGAEYIEDYDLVITNHDKAFDFGSVNTFALPDEVVKLTGNLIKGEDPEFIEDEYADIIINSIRENMEDKGWIEVLKDEDPDVIILPSAVSSTTFIWYYDWWYWDWWYPYYWWGWYYPYPIYGGSIKIRFIQSCGFEECNQLVNMLRLSMLENSNSKRALHENTLKLLSKILFG